MNQTTGDSKKLQISGSILQKGKENEEPIKVPEGTEVETGALVKLAESPETSVEIKTGDIEMVRFTKKEDGIDAIYIPARDEVLIVDSKEVTPEQHATIKAAYEKAMRAKQSQEKDLSEK